jgi:arylsulfatase A-like enzyme
MKKFNIMTLLFYVLFLGAGAHAQSSQPNIVFILTDDLGYGDVSYLYPASKIITPNMDQLAAKGVWLSDAHSPSAICSPTRYSMLTGQYPWRVEKLKVSVLMPWGPPVIKRISSPCLKC